MNAIITIQPRDLGGATVQTVNARDLHEFLEVGKDFSNWMKDQIERARLKENNDFVVFAEKGENPGRPRTEYALTIEAAKHIGMMSGTDKGFEVRDYFIECERRANSPVPSLETDEGKLLLIQELAAKQLTLIAENKRIAAEVAELEPKAIALDRFADHEGQHNVRNAAKLLGIRERLFVAWLIENKWMYRDHGGHLSAYRGKLVDGCLDTKPVEIRHSDYTETRPQPVVTQKGLARLGELLAKDGLLPRKAA